MPVVGVVVGWIEKQECVDDWYLRIDPATSVRHEKRKSGQSPDDGQAFDQAQLLNFQVTNGAKRDLMMRS